MIYPQKKFYLFGQTIALNRRSAFRGGFSLLELLLGLVILSVLAVLLVTNVRSIRGQAASARCVSHLKQIGAANLAYTIENQGRIAARNNVRDANGDPTPRKEWYRYIWRTYFGATNGDGTPKGDTGYCDVLICPGDPTRGGGEGVSVTLQRSYNVNQRLATKSGSRKMNEVSHIARTMYAGDIDWVAAGNSEYIIPDNLTNLNAIPRDRHAGNANFVFLDGHVEAIRIEEIYPGRSRHAIFDLVQP